MTDKPKHLDRLQLKPDTNRPHRFLYPSNPSDTGGPSRGGEASNPSAHRTEQAQLMSYFKDLELKQSQLKEIEAFEASSRPPAHAEERFPDIKTFGDEFEATTQGQREKLKALEAKGSRDIPPHRESLEGIDSIDASELDIARNGVKRFKRVVESAPADIKQFFLRGLTGPMLQAMLLGLKPVAFGLPNEINLDVPQISHVGDSGCDTRRRHLVEVVQPTYQKIKDHIMRVDNSGDIRFIDLITRDYSRKDDPAIHFDDGMVRLRDEDHAIYSYNSVKKLFNAHQDIFPRDNSNNSIESLISKEMRYENHMIKGLLCGYPRHAVEEFWNNAFGQEGNASELLGRRYASWIGDKRDNIVKKKEDALYHLSGMKDFIEGIS